MKKHARLLFIIFSGLALVASLSSLYVHYRLVADPTYTSFCDVSETVSCEAVMTSRFGYVFGIPVAVGGAIWSALVLMLAGLYQLTPLKQVCLQQCRGAAQQLSAHWRNGLFGALRMGARHGAWCVGCCWVLMAILFVGGVMNLLWIALLALLVLIEKLATNGALVGRAVGVVLICWSLATLVV